MPALVAITIACGCTAVRPGLGSTQVAAGPSRDSLTASPEAAASAVETRDFSSSVARQRAAVVRVVAIVPSADMDVDADDNSRTQLVRQLNSGSQNALPRTASRADASGILTTSDGYVLTNAHVVEDASIVKVVLITGDEYPARVVGMDIETDVAVLKIEAQNLAAAALGDSQHLRAGQWVAAIGAPFGFEQSVTVGVVSALARNLSGESSTPFIQTDLNLNPGDSGGPLIDIHGTVVGINAEMALRDGAPTGISFAIPIELAERIATELIRSGHIDRAELGIGFQDVDPHLSAAFGAPVTAGALIHTVVAGGPAEKAGLRAGDIIVAFDGKNVAGSRQLTTAIASLIPGSTVVASFWRRGNRSDVLICSVHSLTREARLSRGSARTVGSARELVAVHRLPPEARKLLGTEGYLIVMAVSERAAAAGLNMGDILLAINTTPVRTPDELQQALAAGQGTLAFLIDRNGARTFIAVPVPQPREASRSAHAQRTAKQ